jgi:hypothetical protein
MNRQGEQHSPLHHEGWMVIAQETGFCRVPIPWLTMEVAQKPKQYQWNFLG